MAKDSGFDPSIEALLAEAETSSSSGTNNVSAGEFNNSKKSIFQSKSSLFSKQPNTSSKSIHEVDLGRREFKPIEKFVNDEPAKFFEDPKYYKTALTGENAYAQRVHQILSKYLTC